MRLRTGQEGARLTVCCAGHPLPVVLRANGTLETGGRPGTLLGLFPDPDLLDQPVDLGPGDALILYTDGVMEGPPFDEGNDLRLSEVLVGSAGGDAEAITAAIENEILTPGRTGHRDDMAFLVLRMTP
jgi:serine phosphatase RsbU (regulator of sigma subunit)